MKKLLSLLFAVAIVFSLATRALAQPDDLPKGQATATHAKKPHEKKKKHHKKKHTVEVRGQGAGVLC
jgi:predicted small lipoprotein YifL